jgi:DEAD/DEAH box helicase domain-containing protein
MGITSARLNSEEITKILNEIILKECEQLQGGNPCNYGDIIILNPNPLQYTYGLNENDILNIIKKLGYNCPSSVLNDLVNAKFLLKFEDKNGNAKYRSIYMDLFIRSANLRTAIWTSNYILKPRLTLVKSTIPFSTDRRYTINPSAKSGIKEIDDLTDLLKKELGDQGAKNYIEIVNEYLKVKGYKGFDLVQIKMISQAIENYLNGKSIGIEAPTGFGKTEVFLFLILFILIKNDFDPNKKILLLYPRKSLMIDNTNRVILLSKIIEKKLGKKVPILIRDGDSKEVVHDGDLIRNGNLKCPNKHSLRYINGRIACSDSNCVYSKEEFYILDSKNYKSIVKQRNELDPLIIISNIYTIANRLLTFEQRNDITVEDFKKMAVVVMDEAHVYTDVLGGVTSAVLEGIKKVNPNLGFIGVSATIPNREEFLSELFNITPTKLAIVSSIDISKSVSQPLNGFKLYILGFFEIRPDVSWQSFAQLWAILASTYSIAYLNQPNTKSYLYQNMIFINNVNELNRFYDGLSQNLGLGEPCKDRVTTSSFNAYSEPFYIYLDNNQYNTLCGHVQKSGYKYNINSIIKDASEIVFMDAANKYSIFEKISKGDYVAIGATSTLELGVDYEGVAFILNAGADDEVEIVQRLGRASRSFKMPRITLGIIVSKNVPLQSFRIHDQDYINRIIYMLSGQLLTQSQNQKIALHVLKNVKPVKYFRELINGFLDLYRNNKFTNKLRDDLENLINSINNNEISKELEELYNSILNNNSVEEQCRNMLDEELVQNEKLSYIRDKFKKELGTWKTDFGKILNELIGITSNLIGSDNILKIQNLGNDILLLINEILKDYSKIEEKITNTKTVNLNQISNEISGILINIHRKIYDAKINTEHIIETLIPYNNKLEINEVSEKLENLNDNIIKNIIDNLKGVKSWLSQYNTSSTNVTLSKELCEKLIVLYSNLRNIKGNTKTDVRNFVFSYSSLSPVGLNIDDRLVKKITVRFYERQGNNWSPIGEIRDINIFDALIKYPPFYVFNYSWYVSQNITNPPLRYGAILLPLNFKYNRWHRVNPSIDDLSLKTNNNSVKGREGEVDIQDVDEIRIYNLLQLESKLGNPLRISPGDSYQNKVPFLKLGVNKQYLNHYLQNNIIQLSNLASNYHILYNPTILSYTRYCYLGNGISNDIFDINCPFQEECSIGRLLLKKGGHSCKFWIRSAKLMTKTALNFDYQLFENSSSQGISINPVVTAYGLDSVSMYRRLYKITFYINDIPKYIYTNPVLRHKLYDTNAIKFEFDRNITKAVLENILSSNPTLHNILLTKYYLILYGKDSIYKGVKELNVSEYKSLKLKIQKDLDEQNKFLDFVYAVLLHTFAHLLYEFLTLKLRVDENLIDYYYDFNIFNPSLSGDSVYVYEKTSTGVLDLSSFILSQFNNNFQNLFNEFCNFVYQEFSNHSNLIQQTAQSLKQLKQSILNSNQNIQQALAELNKLVQDLRKKQIELDLYTFKIYLSEKNDTKNSNFDEAILGSLADIALGNFCIDGCSSCVMGDFCHYPLIQNIITSRQLLEEFLNYICNFQSRNALVKTSVNIKGDSRVGFSLLSHYAKNPNVKALRIETAYLDKDCINILYDLLNSNPNLTIELTTDMKNSKDALTEYSSQIEQLKATGRFKLKLVPKTHIKSYEIEFKDGRKIHISGSWNCEKTSSKQEFTISI